MVNSYLSTKFGVNLLDGRKHLSRTDYDDGWMDDGISPADTWTQSSRANK